jgi:hypothetical protein
MNPETNVFHVDMKFVKGMLDSYRVRGIGISVPQWTSVPVADITSPRRFRKIPMGVGVGDFNAGLLHF